MKKSPISVKYFPTATFRKRRYDQYPSIVHFPDEKTIEENQQDLKEQYGEKKIMQLHSLLEQILVQRSLELRKHSRVQLIQNLVR